MAGTPEQSTPSTSPNGTRRWAGTSFPSTRPKMASVAAARVPAAKNTAKHAETRHGCTVVAMRRTRALVKFDVDGEYDGRREVSIDDLILADEQQEVQ